MSLGSGATGFVASLAEFGVLSDGAACSGLAASAGGDASAGVLGAGADTES